VGLANNPEVFRFSTDDLLERDRMAIWHEVFGRQIIKVQWEALPETRFSHTTTFRKMPGLTLAFGASSGFCAKRTRQLIGDGNDDLLLTINTDGFARVSQFGREMQVGPSDGFLLSAADMSTIHYPDSAQWIVIGVPRKAITAMVSDPEIAVSQTLKQTDALRLLTSYVLSVNNGFSLATPKLRYVFTKHVQDLMSLAIGATPDGAELAHGRGLRAVRLAAIKADIITNPGRRDLSAEMIGKLHGLSASYIRKLFASEGMSFTDFVLEQRLLGAHHMLRDLNNGSISTIAFAAGFNDLSYFNRVFRRRFGMTPSEVRERARRED
jgi:AraC-like DNA-binding protein